MAGGGLPTRVLHPQLVFVQRALRRAPGASLAFTGALLGRGMLGAKARLWPGSNLHPSHVPALTEGRDPIPTAPPRFREGHDPALKEHPYLRDA